MKNYATFKMKYLIGLFLIFAFSGQAQISGTKVIGSAPSDYATFSAAVSVLNSVGVNGAVVFQVKPGTYNEKIWINKIPGVSATNTVSFESQTNDSTSVTLTYSPVSYSDNYTVYMYDADYITFSYLTLASGGSSYANVVVIDSSSDHNTFTHNKIQGYLTSQVSTNQALIYSSGFSEHYNSFTNNNFFQGSYGLYYYGTSTKEIGTVISNNDFIEQYYSGIYLSNQNAALVTGNYIYSSSGTSFRAIQSQFCDDKMIITKNKIDIPNSGGGYGLYLTNSESTAGNEALIANNFFHINTSGATCSGISCISSAYQKIYNNSVNVTGSNNTSYAIIFDGYGSIGLQIKNNILANNAGGPANYCYISTSLFSTDYNSYFTSGVNLCNYYGNLPTLAAWQSATSKDAHSVVVNPPFISNSDLHISTSSVLGSAGVSLVDIADDIDGDSRNTTPDIGADEFTLVSVNENASNTKGIEVFPNPVKENIIVRFDGTSVQYTIVDVSGKVVLSGSLERTFSCDISVKMLKPGMYILRCNDGNAIHSSKFIKSDF